MILGFVPKKSNLFPIFIHKLKLPIMPLDPKKQGRYWYEVGIVQEDGSTITIERFDVYEDAEAFREDYYEKKPTVNSFVDMWEMVDDIPTIVYNLT